MTNHKELDLKVTKTNNELLQLIQQDDQLAFYHLYDRYCKKLYGFVYRYLKQKEDAEEIVQEVFVKIWEARSRSDAFASFEGYLFTIAYNSTISLLRKRVNEVKYLEHVKSLQEPDKAPDLIEEIHCQQLSEIIESLLTRVSPRQREIFRLSRENGLSNDAIAEKLNISVFTVKKHISNTLTFLKANVDNTRIINTLFFCLFLT